MRKREKGRRKETEKTKAGLWERGGRQWQARGKGGVGEQTTVVCREENPWRKDLVQNGKGISAEKMRVG